MAPTRLPLKSVVGNENTNGISTHGITTRSKQMASLKTVKDNYNCSNKRKADSPLKDGTAKRAAFGDITNAFNKSIAPKEADKDKVLVVKKVTVESKVLPSVKTVKQPSSTNSIAQQNGKPLANGTAQTNGKPLTNGTAQANGKPLTNGTAQANGKSLTNVAQINGKPSKAKQLQKVATNALESVQKHFAKEPTKTVATRAQSGILKNAEKRLSGKENQTSSCKSNRSDVSSERSLYTTALENISPADATKEECKAISEKLDKVVLDDDDKQNSAEESEAPHAVPEGVADFDQDNWNDPLQVSHYAMDIFNYLKSRERLFSIDDYLTRIPGISIWMRALLVDWMVEVQESFELNHETLYLAIKLVDLFLARTSKPNVSKNQRENKYFQITKEELQLLGASSLFIAAKFDERVPPLADDFLYICDGAYTLQQLLTMEIMVLRSLDFDLGIPLSYRFLRRYARCARVSMPTLTLARFVLEMCLMEYNLVAHSDSKMAAAALYLALRMKAISGWTPTLQYYTGYTVKEILPLALAQNATLRKKPKTALSTVRNKYSHPIFFEVAKMPLIDDSKLAS